MKLEHPLLDLLRADHDDLRAMLAALADAERGIAPRARELRAAAARMRSRAPLARRLLDTALREEAWSPARKDRIEETLDRHRAAVELVLEHAAIESLEFGARTRVLGEHLERHACEEEDEFLEATIERLLCGAARFGAGSLPA